MQMAASRAGYKQEGQGRENLRKPTVSAYVSERTAAKDAAAHVGKCWHFRLYSRAACWEMLGFSPICSAHLFKNVNIFPLQPDKTPHFTRIRHRRRRSVPPAVLLCGSPPAAGDALAAGLCGRFNHDMHIRHIVIQKCGIYSRVRNGRRLHKA